MFNKTIADTAQLAEHYREPSPLVLAKAIDHLDDGCRAFIEQSTFVLIGTSTDEGTDVSPKGGPAGFVKVLDANHLAIPDLNGNNRLDSVRNVIDNPSIGLLFIIPGLGETLRVNGTAVVSVDEPILDLFTDELRRPTAAIGVNVSEAFIHCAKAFRRGDMWTPDRWTDAKRRPSAGQMLVDHVGLDDITGDELDAMLESGYAKDLAADLPE